MKESSQQLLAKAERAVGAAEVLLTSQHAEFAVGRAYYAMFYVAEALLNESEFAFSKHSAVHAAFGREVVQPGRIDPKFHRWLLDAFDLRLQSDYGFDVSLSHETATTQVGRAREFLAMAAKLLEPDQAEQGPEPAGPSP